MKYNVNLPEWSNELAYFCGLVIGDGSLLRVIPKDQMVKFKKGMRYHL